MKLTPAVAEVAFALLATPSGRHWGYDITKSTGLRSGIVYPILKRMLDEGLLEDGWETVEELSSGRPPRRYYRVTDAGLTELGAIKSRAASNRTVQTLRPREA